MERYDGPYVYIPVRQLGADFKGSGLQEEHVVHAVRTMQARGPVTVETLAALFRKSPDHIRHLLFGPRSRGEVEIFGKNVEAC